jgi:hypothetical protein
MKTVAVKKKITFLAVIPGGYQSGPPSPVMAKNVFFNLYPLGILVVPPGPHGKKGFVLNFNSGISKTKCSTPKWKGVDAHGNAPSQYTGKFVPGYYLSRGLTSWRYG